MLLADLGADVIRVDRPGGRADADAAPQSTCCNRGKRRGGRRPEAPATAPRLVLRLVGRRRRADRGLPARASPSGSASARTSACARNPRAGLRADDRLGPGRAAGRHRRARHHLHRGHRRAARHRPGRRAAAGRRSTCSATSAAGRCTWPSASRRAARRRARSGPGQVVDAAIVDGAAHLTTMPTGMLAGGAWLDERGVNLLDGGAPFYDVYADRRRPARGGRRAGAAVLRRVRWRGSRPEGVPGLPTAYDRAGWPELRARFAQRFATAPAGRLGRSCSPTPTRASPRCCR